MKTSKTATLMRHLEGFTGDARLYQLSEPVTWDEWNDGKEVNRRSSFVVVSAATALFSGPETYVFPASEEGEILDWGELEGSFRGGLDHEEALRGAGYQVA